jgi:hypothetical protein
MYDPWDCPEPEDLRSDYQRDWDSLTESLESLEEAGFFRAECWLVA